MHVFISLGDGNALGVDRYLFVVSFFRSIRFAICLITLDCFDNKKQKQHIQLIRQSTMAHDFGPETIEMLLQIFNKHRTRVSVSLKRICVRELFHIDAAPIRINL